MNNNQKEKIRGTLENVKIMQNGTVQSKIVDDRLEAVKCRMASDDCIATLTFLARLGRKDFIAFSLKGLGLYLID